MLGNRKIYHAEGIHGISSMGMAMCRNGWGRSDCGLCRLATARTRNSRRDGGFAVLATSLADGCVRKVFGDSAFFREEFADGFDVRVRLASEKPKDIAVLVLDNLTAGEAVSTGKSAVLTPQVKPDETFDPVKAGWKKVFEDDFNGTDIDWSKWYQNPWSRNKQQVSLEGEGHLAIKCDFKPGTTNLAFVGTRPLSFLSVHSWGPLLCEAL